MDTMRWARRQRGEGRIGFVIALLLFAIAVYLGIKIIPVKIKLYAFSDEIEQHLQRASWKSWDVAKEETLTFVKKRAMATGLETNDLKIQMPAPVTGEMVIIVDWGIPL